MIRLAFAMILSILILTVSVSSSFAANCDSTSKGYLPVNTLTGTYKGQSGGLYPGGLNVPPAYHDSIGRVLAKSFAPLDSAGAMSPEGVWVLLSVGMSNCTQEYSQFITDVTGDTTLNPRLRIIDGAQGGQTAAKIKYDTATFWNVIENRLHTRGLSSKQVQAIWLKEANAGPTQAFPVHAQMLRDDLVGVVRVARAKYQNLKQVFFSSRTYGGYANTTLNPEPYAYESAFSFRWLVEAQINGNDSLNYDPANGDVRAAWMGWGPYLWADGIIPRQPDSLQWFCDDFQASDGTHPSTSGRIKVSNLLEKFFKSSPYTTPWFLKSVPILRGDLDGSGAVDISDVIALLDIIFNGAPLPDPKQTGDPDCSGNLDISDAVFLIAYIFNGGPAPCG